MTSIPWQPSVLDHRSFRATDLLGAHPLTAAHANKHAVFDVSQRVAVDSSQTLTYTRWSAFGWAERYSNHHAGRVDVVDGLFEYTGDSSSWHLNFADPDLFGYYKTGLFAQDEMQVAEHPSLGALRERLIRDGADPRTVEHSLPTPCTVTNVPRQCRVDTEPAGDAPSGIYGNRFSATHRELIERRTHPVSPATLSNILAIAAPSCGDGQYRPQEISYILATLVTGFAAAEAITGPTTRIMTGFWGCGAFGGNCVLTPALQIVAAAWVGIDRLVFHAFDEQGRADIASAQAVANQLLPARKNPESLDQFIHEVTSLGFEWGQGDGN